MAQGDGGGPGGWRWWPRRIEVVAQEDGGGGLGGWRWWPRRVEVVAQEGGGGPGGWRWPGGWRPPRGWRWFKGDGGRRVGGGKGDIYRGETEMPRLS